jgi:hypothetical protein
MSGVTLLVRAALCQGAGLLLSLTAHQLGWLSGWPLLWLAAVGALGSAMLARLPRWWWLIQALFPPAVGLALAADLPAMAYAGALLVSLLVFGAVARSRVPLWLSGAHARQRLIEHLPSRRSLRAVDLGSGTGGLLLALWRSGRCAECVGVEWALLPWLIGWLRLRRAGFRGRWRLGSFWSEPLGDYDLVYAFLSPAAMPALWRKAGAEMRPGSWLVSYRFEIPGVPPQQRWPVGRTADDALLLWVMPG